MLNFQDHFVRRVFNNDNASPSEIAAIFSEVLLACRYQNKMVTDTILGLEIVPYSCICGPLELLTLHEQKRLISFPSDRKYILRKPIFCQARQMFEDFFSVLMRSFSFKTQMDT